MSVYATRRRFVAASAFAGALAAAGCNRARNGGAGAGLARLAQTFEGRLLAPSDEEYEQARRVASFNPRFDRRPFAIARCASAADIARAIAFARENQLEIAVRGGGHDVLAASTCDGGLVLDLGGMAAISVDDGDGAARVGAGVRAGQLNAELGGLGRAAALGCNAAVGVSGLTLGGGLGWFIARHGASCDTVESARIVTAAGEILDASSEENPELFWAIRGGGGNFGVVSEWTYKTFPQGDVVAGVIVYRGDQLGDFLAFYRDQIMRAPDDLTVEVVGLGNAEPVVMALIVYSGDPARADAALAPWRSFGPPLADGLSQRPFARLEEVAENILPFIEWQGEPARAEDQRPGSYWKGASVDALSDGVIAAIKDAAAAPPLGWTWGLGHVMRGAVARAPESATPLVRKAGLTSIHFDGGWEYESRAGEMMAWIDDAIDAIMPHAGAGDYVNYLSSDDPARVRASYGPHYERLSAAKRRFDPENVFRRNRNIAPA